MLRFNQAYLQSQHFSTLSQLQLRLTLKLLSLINWVKKLSLGTHFHVGIFLHGGESGQVLPGHFVSVFVVITFVLQVPERCSSEPVELQSKLRPFFIGYDVNIWNAKKKNEFLNFTLFMCFTLDNCLDLHVQAVLQPLLTSGEIICPK